MLVPGSTTAVRVNVPARLTADMDLRAQFERDGKTPRTVIVIRVAEVYSQCARALQRSALWTAGDMLDDATRGEINGQAYDAERATRAHLGWL